MIRQIYVVALFIGSAALAQPASHWNTKAALQGTSFAARKIGVTKTYYGDVFLSFSESSRGTIVFNSGSPYGFDGSGAMEIDGTGALPGSVSVFDSNGVSQGDLGSLGVSVAVDGQGVNTAYAGTYFGQSTPVLRVHTLNYMGGQSYATVDGQAGAPCNARKILGRPRIVSTETQPAVILYVAELQNSASVLRIAERSGGSWTCLDIDGQGAAPGQKVLSVKPEISAVYDNASGSLHVAYIMDSGVLRYATRSSSGLWSYATARESDSLTLPALLYWQGAVYIGFFYGGGELQMVQRLPGGAWTFRRVARSVNAAVAPIFAAEHHTFAAETSTSGDLTRPALYWATSTGGLSRTAFIRGSWRDAVVQASGAAVRDLAFASSRQWSYYDLLTYPDVFVSRGPVDALTLCPYKELWGEGSWPGACYRSFSDVSVWNRKVPPSPPIDQKSDLIISRMLDTFGDHPAKNGTGGPDTGTWNNFGVKLDGSGNGPGEPTYFSRPTDPAFTIQWTMYCDPAKGIDCSNPGQIQIPPNALPEGASFASGDRHMAVVDTWNQTVTEFWQVQQLQNGVIKASSVSRSSLVDDYKSGINGVSTAACFSNIAGRTRVEELASREIRHALFLTVQCGEPSAGNPTKTSFRFPACQGTGTVCGPDPRPDPTYGPRRAPELGMHLWLDMTEQEVNALAVSDWEKTLLHAMREYGMFIGDYGSFMAIELESGLGYTRENPAAADRWLEFAQSNGWTPWPITTPATELLGKLENNASLWQGRLRVLDACVDLGTCP